MSMAKVIQTDISSKIQFQNQWQYQNSIAMTNFMFNYFKLKGIIEIGIIFLRL